MKPFDRLIVVDALQVADQHGVIKAQAWAEFAQRRGGLGNEQTQLNTERRATADLKLTAEELLPIAAHLVHFGDAARLADLPQRMPAWDFRAVGNGTEPAGPETVQAGTLQKPR